MTPPSTWNEPPVSPPGCPDARHPRKDAPSSPQAQGFTLLEVMVAISLLAIALTTLFGSQAQSVSLASTVQFNTQAPLLARLKLAELTAMGDRPDSQRGDFGAEFPDYHWQMEAKEVSLESSRILKKPAEALQRLTLTISWGDRDRFTYTLDSYTLKKPEA